jgi:hypothetical protein
MKHALLPALCVLLSAREDEPCVHRGAGAAVAVSLERVGRAQEEVREKLALVVEKAARLSPGAPFESGLPACRGRATRTVRTDVPAPLVGKTIAFGPSGRMPPADLRVATSARNLLELEADALADPALAARLGVRCVPTRVRATSEVELELAENP